MNPRYHIINERAHSHTYAILAHYSNYNSSKFSYRCSQLSYMCVPDWQYACVSMHITWSMWCDIADRPTDQPVFIICSSKYFEFSFETEVKDTVSFFLTLSSCFLSRNSISLIFLQLCVRREFKTCRGAVNLLKLHIYFLTISINSNWISADSQSIGKSLRSQASFKNMLWFCKKWNLINSDYFDIEYTLMNHLKHRKEDQCILVQFESCSIAVDQIERS